MITIRHKLDMTPGGIPTVINVSQYDSSFTLELELFARNGTLQIPAGATAEIRGTKSDGNAYSADASINGNIVSVTGHQQMTAVKGRQIFEITLYSGETELSSANFVLNVERAPMDKDTIPSESIIRELVDVIDQAEEIIQAASNALAAAQAAALAAESAETSAGNASSSETAAEEAKDDAQMYEQKIENMSVTSRTLSPGESASVTKRETATGFWLEFGIPKGDVGKGVAAAGLTEDYKLRITYTDGSTWTSDESIKGPKGDSGTAENLGLSVVDGAINYTWSEE